jgi:hypothetical protein
MPSDLKVTLSLEIKPDGPRFNLVDLMKVDAYDRSDVELVAGGPVRRIDLQPNTNSDQLRLLLVARSAPDPKKTEKPDPQKLRYQVNGQGRWVPLENWHLLMSPGFFDVPEEVPTWLNFENKQEDNVVITTLVARNAPPAEEPPDGEPPAAETETPTGEMPAATPVYGAEPDREAAEAGTGTEPAPRPTYRTGGTTAPPAAEAPAETAEAPAEGAVEEVAEPEA